MSCFADSSALVKLYADEEDHEVVRALDAMAISALAQVEVPAALWRKHRIDELSDQDTGLLVRAFQFDFHGAESEPPRFAAVAVTAPILDHAATLVATHALRAYDALQLSTGLATRSADPECDNFACFDRSLRAAAAAQGFALVP